MAMDLVGASLTTNEIRSITADIEQISRDVSETMKNVSGIMTDLTGKSEGGVIEKTTVAVQQLNALVETLVACILNIGLKIGDFLNAMINHDADAAQTIRNSIESRVYGS